MIFAAPHRLEVFKERGFLAVMDSTHKLNKLQWLLYTILVRSEYGNWIPAAHILIAKEDSHIVASAFAEIVRPFQGIRIPHQSDIANVPVTSPEAVFGELAFHFPL